MEWNSIEGMVTIGIVYTIYTIGMSWDWFKGKWDKWNGK